MSEERIGRRAVVSGEVQGVFFRTSCRQIAREHGVAGSARNLPDGTVEVILEGAPHAVAEVLAWCEHGPDHATVSSVTVTEETPRGLEGFSIA
jgi:acylphosphatase